MTVHLVLGEFGDLSAGGDKRRAGLFATGSPGVDGVTAPADHDCGGNEGGEDEGSHRDSPVGVGSA
jgi:hypothetical protein